MACNTPSDEGASPQVERQGLDNYDLEYIRRLPPAQAVGELRGTTRPP